MRAVMTYWPVAAPLAGLVDAIYVLRAPGPHCRELTGSLLPQVEWLLRGRFGWECRDGKLQMIADAAALGPSTAAMHLETFGDTVLIGMGIYPEGWASLLPVPAGDVVEQVCDLTDLWGEVAREPLAFDPDQTDVALAAQLEAFMLRRLDDARPLDPRVTAISRWANGSDHDIGALCEELGVSHRQLDRLCVAAHGLPPRVLANKHKVLRMAAVLALGQRDNRREVWTSEYSDQSHFNRNFKRFIGVSPTRFLADPEVLVRDVMRVRLAVGSPHPLGLTPS